jgi:hypothetical protein
MIDDAPANHIGIRKVSVSTRRNQVQVQKYSSLYRKMLLLEPHRISVLFTNKAGFSVSSW